MVNYKMYGLDCIIKKQEMGHYCGYIVLPDSLHNLSTEISERFDIHGGITFDGDMYNGKFKGKRVIGFDCAHGGDIDYETIGGKHKMINLVKKPTVEKWLKELAIQVRLVQLMAENNDFSMLGLKSWDNRTNIFNVIHGVYNGS